MGVVFHLLGFAERDQDGAQVREQNQMMLEVGGAWVPLKADPGFELLQIPDADDPAAIHALNAGAWTGFQTT
ncbi:MAG: hypothetical protein V4812_15230, partial [Pseudomonadota bacterium]